jgi:hypothetical protein
MINGFFRYANLSPIANVSVNGGIGKRRKTLRREKLARGEIQVDCAARPTYAPTKIEGVFMTNSGSPKGGFPQLWRKRAATRLAANLAPKANLNRGPKLLAAAAPIKYRPGTEDSKWRFKAGASSALLRRDWIES